MRYTTIYPNPPSLRYPPTKIEPGKITWVFHLKSNRYIGGAAGIAQYAPQGDATHSTIHDFQKSCRNLTGKKHAGFTQQTETGIHRDTNVRLALLLKNRGSGTTDRCLRT